MAKGPHVTLTVSEAEETMGGVIERLTALLDQSKPWYQLGFERRGARQGGRLTACLIELRSNIDVGKFPDATVYQAGATLYVSPAAAAMTGDTLVLYGAITCEPPDAAGLKLVIGHI